MKTRIILIEFDKGPRGAPWMLCVEEIDRGRKSFLHYYIERSKRAGGLWHHMWGAGMEPRLEEKGRNRYWVAPEYLNKVGDKLKGRNRMSRPPRGRFDPSKGLDAYLGGDDGDWCSECGDFIPAEWDHDVGCKEGA